MTTTRKIRISHRVHLIIDHNDEATPAMVESGRYASSYDWVMNTGDVDDSVFLTDQEMEKLETYRDDVEQAFEIARKDSPEYN